MYSENIQREEELDFSIEKLNCIRLQKFIDFTQ